METLSTGQKAPKKETILVVDDEAGQREALRLILKPLYEVLTASDGQEALRLMKSKEVDIVTLDLNMPGLSGLEVLKEIKKHKPATEVIVVTGHGTLNNAQEAFRFGAGGLISKPFQVPEIISIVAKSSARRNSAATIHDLIGQVQKLRAGARDIYP